MSRLWNLIKGFFNLFVSRAEQKNPDIAYDNAIDSTISNYSKLKSAAGAVVRRANDLEAEYKEKSAILTRMDAQLEVAAKMENPDVEIAAQLMTERDNLAQALVNMKIDWDQAEKDEADIREALLEVEGNIRKLQAEKQINIGRYRASNARIAIQEQLSGISISADIKALDNVRNNIKNRVAEANLVQDLQSNTLDNRLKKFEKATTAASGKDKFLAMREQMKAKGATPRTL